MEESCLLWSSNCCWAAFPKWDETKSEDLIFRLHRDAHGERQTMPSTMLKLAAESPLNISYLFLRNLRAKLDLLLLSHLKYSFKTKKKKKCTFGNIYGWNTPQVYGTFFLQIEMILSKYGFIELSWKLDCRWNRSGRNIRKLGHRVILLQHLHLMPRSGGRAFVPYSQKLSNLHLTSQ